MMFLLHLGLLLYGLASLVIGKLRTSGGMWDAANKHVYEFVEQFWPESLFKPWKADTDELTPDLTRTYLIGGALVAYSLRYLFSNHRNH